MVSKASRKKPQKKVRSLRAKSVPADRAGRVKAGNAVSQIQNAPSPLLHEMVHQRSEKLS